MGRLVWVGVGAVGGIYTYRKGERAVAAMQAQEAMRVVRVVRVVASARRRPQNPSMALHPASGGPKACAVPAAAPAGLRVGRFRITRTDEPTHVPDGVADGQGRSDSPEPQYRETAADREVVDITEAARRGRRAGVSARRKVR